MNITNDQTLSNDRVPGIDQAPTNNQTKNRHIVLMTTADAQSDRKAALIRMIDSLEAFRLASPATRVDHYLLMQRCDDVAAVRAAFGLPDWINVSVEPSRVPLSIARNRMIDRVIAEVPGIDAATVAFPDDDAWYPRGALEYIDERFANDPEIDFWFCRYGTEAVMPAVVEEVKPSLQTTVANASSNTIVIRGRVLRAIGGFDEALGLGTPAKSGEDTEFAIRSYLASRKVSFAPYRMVGHRDFDPAIRATYYAGTLVALGRHLPVSQQLAYPFVRKVLVGSALVAKRELSVSDLMGAFRLYRENRKAPNGGAGHGRPSDIRLAGPSLKQGEAHRA